MMPKRTPRVIRASWQVVVDELRIDRLQLTPHPTPSLEARVWAWMSIAMLFLLGFGIQTAIAIGILLGNLDVSGPVSDDTAATQAVVFVPLQMVVIAAAAVTIAVFRRYAHSPRPHVAWHTTWRTYLAGFLGPIAGFAAAGGVSALFSIPQNSYPAQTFDGPVSYLYGLWHSAIAGPLEETVLVALVVVALRTVGQSWAVVITVAVLLRIPFHLYYGWGFVAAAVWPVLTVLLYRRTAALFALMAFHSTWDVLIFFDAPRWLFLVLPVAGGAVLLSQLIVAGRRAHPTGTASGPDPRPALP